MLRRVNPYQPPAAPREEPRPAPAQGPAKPGLTTGVQAVAVTMIFFGGMGLLGTPLAFLVRGMSHDPVSTRIQEITWEGAMGGWTRVSLGLGTLLSVVLLASGIGVFKRKGWARRAGVAYACVSLAMQVIGLAMTFLVLFPALDELAEQYRYDRTASAAVMGGRIGGAFGGIFALALPIAILVVMTRPGVKAQLTE
jgi:hypothetical protein